MTKPKQPFVIVRVQLDNKRNCGAHAVATIQCITRTPRWRNLKNTEFVESARFGAHLEVSGNKDQVLSTLREISSLIKTAGDLGYKVQKLVERFDFIRAQVMENRGQVGALGNVIRYHG